MKTLKKWYFRLLFSLIIGQTVVQMFPGFNYFIFFITIIISFIILSAMATKL
ncbi:hypothetical protein [uncultured Tenacibaculum sp.]|uniref:hypothetical protein n=1 Tax=uncultured Tenacibaculum sp. TaxID=174713 RepID=UPI002629EB9B|nr:hypothetical protein [uncultured Tenacibaculum sp.]